MPDSALLVEAVRRASEATLAAFKRGVNVIEKKDGTPVTLADYTAQAVLLHHLEGTLGPQAVWAEESGSRLSATEFDDVRSLAEGIGVQMTRADVENALARRRPPTGDYWALDPLDGTRGFVRRDQWAVALAWVVDGRPQHSVVGLPRLGDEGVTTGAGRILWAQKGKGAWQQGLQNGSAQRVAARGPGTQPFVVAESAEYNHTVRMGEHDNEGRKTFEWASLRADGQVKYGLLSLGRADIYVRNPRNPKYREKVWDHAPGSLIAEECGLKVADFDGRALDFSAPPHFKPRGGIFAAPQSQWDEIMTMAPRRGS